MRHFVRGSENFLHVYRPLEHQFAVYDNSAESPQLLERCHEEISSTQKIRKLRRRGRSRPTARWTQCAQDYARLRNTLIRVGTVESRKGYDRSPQSAAGVPTRKGHVRTLRLAS
jgi:hypothetical protein